MPGISTAKDLPREIYHWRALSNELWLRAVTGTSFFTIRVHPMGPSNFRPIRGRIKSRVWLVSDTSSGI